MPCAGLKYLVIPPGVTHIGDAAFDGCPDVEVVAIMPGTRSIGYRAFYGMPKLREVVIPSTVTSIADEAFEACHSLTTVVLPDEVKDVSRSAFRNCYGHGLEAPGVNSSTRGTLRCLACAGVHTLVVPANTTGIGELAFAGCADLASVVLHEGLYSIAPFAFQGATGLTSVSIPNSCGYVGHKAFAGCSNLAFVNIPAALPEGKVSGGVSLMLDSDVFADTPCCTRGSTGCQFAPGNAVCNCEVCPASAAINAQQLYLLYPDMERAAPGSKATPSQLTDAHILVCTTCTYIKS